MTYLDKDALKVVGTRPIRPDGVDKVTGRANFGADMVMPGIVMSAPKLARPVTLSTPSGRIGRVPTTRSEALSRKLIARPPRA